MNLSHRNALANLLTQGLSVAMSLLYVPVYLHLIGVEAYGVLTFGTLLLYGASLLDLGFGAVLTRLAAMAGPHGQGQLDLPALVRTQQVVMAAVLGAALLLGLALAPWLAALWFSADQLSPALLRAALEVIFLTTLLQVGAGYFAAGLRGLQRQIELNAWTLLFTALRMFGALPFMWWQGEGLLFLLAWQAAVSALQLGVLRARLLQHLGAGQVASSSRWAWATLRQQGGYAANVFVVGWLSFLLLQGDRLILSHYLPLQGFAAYSVAASLAALLLMVSASLGGAYFPQYSSLSQQKDLKNLLILYRSSTQLMAGLVLCVVGLIALYPQQILQLWTHNASLATQAAPVARALVLGYGINALLSLPYQLQLAYAWTRLSVAQLVVSAPLSLLAVWWLASRGHVQWVPWVWPAVNLAYLLVGIPIMHRRLLRGEQGHWYLHSFLLPGLAVLAVLGLPLLLGWVPQGSAWLQLLSLAVLGGCSLLAALAVTHGGRAALRNGWRLLGLRSLTAGA